MHIRQLALVALFVVVAPGFLAAQQASGTSSSVTIRVTDPTRAPISQAQVRSVPTADAGKTVSITDAKGELNIALKPGSYEVFVTAQGFKTVAQCIDVSDAAKEVAITLRPGDVWSPMVVSKDSLVVSVNLSDAPVHPPTVLDPTQVHALPHVQATVHNPHTNADETYSGVPIADVLVQAGAPPIKALHGKALTSYLLATGFDGYQVVLAIGELDPTLHSGSVLVADVMDGKPLDAKNGPFKLVVTEDKRPARSVHNLLSLDLKSAQ